MKLALLKGALRPAAGEDTDELRTLVAKHGYKVGDMIEVEVLNERRAKFNSKVHVTLDEIAKLLGVTLLQLRAEILIETGRAELLKLRDGRRVWALPSMSRASMTQKELESFWDDARDYVRDKIVPKLGVDAADHVNNLLNDGVLP